MHVCVLCFALTLLCNVMKNFMQHAEKSFLIGVLSLRVHFFSVVLKLKDEF